MAIEEAYRSGPSMAQLRAFVTVAETGSFSAAALALDLSQASISHAVAQAEHALGVRLFRRGGFGARLTTEGERLLPAAVRALRAARTLMQEARLLRGALEGTLRVAAFPSVAQFVLPRWMKALTQAHPDIALQPVDIPSNSEEVLSAVEGGTADLGLVVARLSDAVIHWRLFEDPFVVCVPASLACERPTWETLQGLPLIAYDKDWRDDCVLGARYALEQIGADEPGHLARETGTILGMVGQGLGFAVLPALAVSGLPEGVRRAPLEVPRVRTVHLALPPELLRAPLVRAALEVLRRSMPESEIPPLAPGIERSRRADVVTGEAGGA